jgi:hypothetical protein
MMTSGHSSICAIRMDDVLYCWGHNDSYQLGREPAVGSDSSVVPVTGSLSAKMVSGSDIGACALDLAGAAWCWGGGSSTALGTANGSDTHIPQPVAGTMTFTSIAAGNSHQCALTASGDAYCWGLNSSGELGIGTMGATASIGPQPVTGGHKFVSIMTTNKGNTSHEGTCGITTADDLLCWGLFEPDAIHARAGAAAAAPYHIAPGMKFRGLSKRYIADEVCAIAVDGRAYCW